LSVNSRLNVGDKSIVKNSKREGDDRQTNGSLEKGMLIWKKWKFLAESYLDYLTNQQNGNPSLLRLMIYHSWSDMRETQHKVMYIVLKQRKKRGQ